MALYVFDTGAFIHLFRYYYESRFPTLWTEFYRLVSDGQIVSVREVLNEITDKGQNDRLSQWANENGAIFHQPTSEEGEFVQSIFTIPEFLPMIQRKNILRGRPVADPFLVAKARAENGCLVTLEKYRNNSAKIPNVCERFGISCKSLEGFMEDENWEF